MYNNMLSLGIAHHSLNYMHSMTPAQLHHTGKLILDQKPSSQHMRRFHLYMPRLLQACIQGTVPDLGVFSDFLGLEDPNILTVDYGMSLHEMLELCNWKSVHPGITADEFVFEGTGVQQFQFEILSYEEPLLLQEAVTLLEQDSDPKNPWRPGRIEHLLAWATKFPDIRKEIVMAVGSLTKDKKTPFMGHDAFYRHLDLSVEGVNFCFPKGRKYIRVRQRMPRQ